VKDWKKIYQAYGNLKQTRVVFLMSEKTVFKQKSIRRGKE
jgi:hypothetical protein